MRPIRRSARHFVPGFADLLAFSIRLAPGTCGALSWSLAERSAKITRYLLVPWGLYQKMGRSRVSHLTPSPA